MWFGLETAMTQLPDPDPGLPLSPSRRLVEHELASGRRAVDVIGRPVRDLRLNWSGLTPAETALIEAYADGENGPGPFFVLLDGAPGWNYLHPLIASASSLTGDASGWEYDGPTALTSVASPVLRGPRALKWTVDASGSQRWMWPDWQQVPATLPLAATGTPWTFTFNARTLAGTATVFGQIFGGLDSTDGPDTALNDTGWATVSVTHTPATATGFELFIAKQPGTAADIIIDTPRLSIGAGIAAWTPGRGIPLVSIADSSIVARWNDLYDVSLTLREVG